MTSSSDGIGIDRVGLEAGLDRYYDSMFRDREAIFPEALELDFWRDHFVLRACRDSEILGGHVVDLACGTGEVDVLVVQQLPAVTHVTGIDISDLGLSYARRHRESLSADLRQRLQFHKADINATGLPAGCADAVLLSHTLEHLWNPAPVLREMGRLLSADGLALVVLPNGHHHDDPDHKRHLDADGYMRLLRRYGDVVRSWTSEEGDQLAFVVRPSARPRLVAMVRVRNEYDHMVPLFDHLAGWVDAAVVLDDGSTDGTAEVCDAHPLVARVERNGNPTTDEVRDKNRLLQIALEADAEWVIALDADERIEPGGGQLLRTLVDTAPPWIDCLTLDCLHLWDSPLQARFDGAYGRDIRHPRLFRAEAATESEARFVDAGHGAGLHCGSVPLAVAKHAVPTPVRFLHLGYLNPDIRSRKVGFYQRMDPDSFASGAYEHILTPPELILPVTDRRDLLARLAWSWSGEEGPVRSDQVGPHDNVVIVDGQLPEQERRAVQETRSGYRVQIGGEPSVWADLHLASMEEARKLLLSGLTAVGFANQEGVTSDTSERQRSALRPVLAGSEEHSRDAADEIAAAVAWRAEFEASRAGRLILAWRRLRDRRRRS